MMSSHALPEPIAPPNHSTWAARLYVAAWGLLAACALAYLAVLVARPDLADAVVGQSQSSAQIAVDRPEFDGLRRELGGLRMDIAAVRQDSDARNGRERMIAERLAALEVAASKASDIVETPSQTPRGADQAVITVPAIISPDKPAMPFGTTVRPDDKAAKAPPRPPVAAAASAPATTAPATTASVLPRPAAPSALRVATGPSVDALRLSWQLLLEGQRSVLGPLEPRWVEVPGTPSSFALIAGPLLTADDAAKTCATLKAKKITCSVAKFGGQPL